MAHAADPRRSLCIGLVGFLLVFELGMVAARILVFQACGSAGELVDPLWLSDRLRQGAGLVLVVHAAALGGLVVVALVEPALVVLRFAAWSLFAMTIWMAAYLVQGLDRVADCARWSLHELGSWSAREIGLELAIPDLVAGIQSPALVVLGLVFLVVMHVCLCLAVLRTGDGR